MSEAPAANMRAIADTNVTEETTKPQKLTQTDGPFPDDPPHLTTAERIEYDEEMTTMSEAPAANMGADADANATAETSTKPKKLTQTNGPFPDNPPHLTIAERAEYDEGMMKRAAIEEKSKGYKSDKAKIGLYTANGGPLYYLLERSNRRANDKETIPALDAVTETGEAEWRKKKEEKKNKGVNAAEKGDVLVKKQEEGAMKGKKRISPEDATNREADGNTGGNAEVTGHDKVSNEEVLQPDDKFLKMTDASQLQLGDVPELFARYQRLATNAPKVGSYHGVGQSK